MRLSEGAGSCPAGSGKDVKKPITIKSCLVFAGSFSCASEYSDRDQSFSMISETIRLQQSFESGAWLRFFGYDNAILSDFSIGMIFIP